MAIVSINKNKISRLSEEGNNKELLEVCIDVIYHNNMKAFGLHQLILLYIQWEKEKNKDEEEI